MLHLMLDAEQHREDRHVHRNTVVRLTEDRQTRVVIQVGRKIVGAGAAVARCRGIERAPMLFGRARSKGIRDERTERITSAARAAQRTRADECERAGRRAHQSRQRSVFARIERDPRLRDAARPVRNESGIARRSALPHRTRQ